MNKLEIRSIDNIKEVLMWDSDLKSNPALSIPGNAVKMIDSKIGKASSENDNEFVMDRFCLDFKMDDITLNIKADIKVIDMPLLDTTKHKDLLGNFISDLILQVLSYVAEQERTFIKQRQREGIDIAKSKGVKFGRKRIEYPSNWNEVIYKWKNNEITARKSMELLGLKQTTFYKLVREEK